MSSKTSSQVPTSVVEVATEDKGSEVIQTAPVTSKTETVPTIPAEPELERELPAENGAICCTSI